MLRTFLYILNIFFLISFNAYGNEELKVIKRIKKETLSEKTFSNQKRASLEWEKVFEKDKSQLNWEKVDEGELNIFLENANRSQNHSPTISVKSLDRSVTVNNLQYPEISHYVPNGYVSSDQKFLTTSLRTISKLRFCDGKNFSYKCADGLLNIDLNLIKTESFSFNSKFSLQSISNRGTDFGEESSLGFKIAKQFSPNLSLAIGGENIIHLDKNIDLGRNLYLISSTFKQFGKSDKDNPSMLFLNIGIGSDFYGYKGNGFLWRAPCLGKPNLTGDANDNCSWGPIGSISLAPNDRVNFINEWFGYSYGSGVSIKPFKEGNIVMSIYATDYIKGFPKYAENHCPRKKCDPRFYGNISVSF